jgi:hypothetical protein
MPVARWTDDRLDDFFRRFNNVEPVAKDVAVMQSELRSLTKAVDHNTKATERVAKQLEDAKLEPFTRGRSVRTQLLIVLVSAIVGGGFVLLSALLFHG